jgi:hypothetical protein
VDMWDADANPNILLCVPNRAKYPIVCANDWDANACGAEPREGEGCAPPADVGAVGGLQLRGQT